MSSDPDVEADMLATLKQLRTEGRRVVGLLTEIVSVLSVIKLLLTHLLESPTQPITLTTKERLAIKVLLRITR